MLITQLAPDPCPGQGSGANCVIYKNRIIYIIIHITQGVCVIIQGVSIMHIMQITQKLRINYAQITHTLRKNYAKITQKLRINCTHYA